MSNTIVSPPSAQVGTSRIHRPLKSLSKAEKERLLAPLFEYLECEAEILGLSPDLEITRFTKAEGPLTKRISLRDGKPESDGSACWMVRGTMERLHLRQWRDFAEMIETTPRNVAYALGNPRDDIPDSARLVKKNEEGDGAFARTADNIAYSDAPSLVLLDFDTKGMPDDVRKSFNERGGFVAVLESLCPGIASAGYIRRLSTSAGLYNAKTGARYHKATGEHVYLLTKDGTDAERFLRTLHDRAWFNGFGWNIVGKNGALLERSIVDRMVYAPERLVFEGNPDLDPPLAQEPRRALVHDGTPFDTIASCPNLTIVERQELERLRAVAKQALTGECAKARDTFVREKTKKAIADDATPETARLVAEKWADGVLRPWVTLEFDDPSLRAKSVKDVLDEPARYVGETLADPIEGVAYGRNIGVVGRRGDEIIIYSWAHGGAIYRLRHSFPTVDTAIRAAPTADATSVLCRLAPFADLNKVEEDNLIQLVKERCGAKVVAIRAMLKDALSDHKKQDKVAQKAKAANNALPTIRLEPGSLPQVTEAIHAALIAAKNGLYRRAGRVMRIAEDILKRPDGSETKALIIHEVSEHDLLNEIAACAHFVRPDEMTMTWQPADPTLTHVRVLQGKEFRLGLPRLSGVTATPLLLPDGRLIDKPGYDLGSELYFNPLGAVFPKIADKPSRADALAALETLDELLVDFPFVDNPSHSVALAALLTGVIRRGLPTAPGIGFDAPEPGTGKSYLMDLISLLATGQTAPVIAAGGDDTELEKRLDALLLKGVAVIAIDNISRQLECDKLNQIMTQETVTIRVLGSTKDSPTVTPGAIVLLDGNNFRIVSDTQRRFLLCSMDAKMERPETRNFKANPAKLIKENRGKYVAAALAIVRAFMVSGEKATKNPLGSYEQWCIMVREPLIWLGRDDPVATQETIRAKDPKRGSRKSLVEAWWECFGDHRKTVKQVIDAALEHDPPPKGVKDGKEGPLMRPWLYGPLAEIASGRDGIDARRLGNWLSREEGRVVDRMRFEREGESHHVTCWKLVTIEAKTDEAF